MPPTGRPTGQTRRLLPPRVAPPYVFPGAGRVETTAGAFPPRPVPASRLAPGPGRGDNGPGTRLVLPAPVRHASAPQPGVGAADSPAPPTETGVARGPRERGTAPTLDGVDPTPQATAPFPATAGAAPRETLVGAPPTQPPRPGHNVGGARHPPPTDAGRVEGLGRPRRAVGRKAGLGTHVGGRPVTGLALEGLRQAGRTVPVRVVPVPPFQAPSLAAGLVPPVTVAPLPAGHTRPPRPRVVVVAAAVVVGEVAGVGAFRVPPVGQEGRQVRPVVRAVRPAPVSPVATVADAIPQVVLGGRRGAGETNNKNTARPPSGAAAFLAARRRARLSTDGVPCRQSSHMLYSLK